MRSMIATAGVGLGLVLGLSGCFPIRVETGHDPSGNFAARRTYAWKSGPRITTGDPRFENPQMEAQLKQTIDSVLTEKGFSKVESNPGFLVDVEGKLGAGTSTVVRRPRQDDSVPDWRWMGSNTVHYEQGALILEMTDPSSGQPLWRAVATGMVQDQVEAEERRERGKKAVRKMLEDFPPKP